MECTLSENGDIVDTATHIHHTNAQLFLILSEHRIAGSQLFENNIFHFQAAAAYALLNVLCRVNGACHQVHLGLKSNTGHAEWLLDRKSTRLNSSHVASSYAVFCLKVQ